MDRLNIVLCFRCFRECRIEETVEVLMSDTKNHDYKTFRLCKHCSEEIYDDIILYRRSIFDA